MKIIRVLLATSLVLPIVLMASLDQRYNGKNGKNGQPGENGEKGENGGLYGGNGGNGGDGGEGGDGGNGGNGGFFGGNGGNGGKGGKGKSQKKLPVNIESGQVDELEYKMLKDACRTVIGKVEERLTESGNLSSSIVEQILQSELSAYLLSLGTPASQKIRAEYEAVGWRYPDIKNI